MRKLIIIIFSIMLSILMFGCASNDLNTPKDLELKDEYKSDISTNYPDNFKQLTLYLTDSYKNIENLSIEDLKKYGELSTILKEGREVSAFTKTEKLLLNKAVTVQGDLMIYSSDKKADQKVKVKEDLQKVLDLYK